MNIELPFAATAILPTLRSQRGFNLVEVLVALIVLAVGLLGLATLQNLGLRFGHQSYERTQATILIYDIVDRMRANPTGVNGGAYAIALTGSPPSVSSDCNSTACNAAEMATFDLSEWLSNISGQATPANPGVNRPMLAGGQGEIVSIGGSRFDITIQWVEQRQGAGVAPEAMRQTMRVHLP